VAWEVGSWFSQGEVADEVGKVDSAAGLEEAEGPREGRVVAEWEAHRAIRGRPPLQQTARVETTPCPREAQPESSTDPDRRL
jgi:hypothetical protein